MTKTLTSGARLGLAAVTLVILGCAGSYRPPPVARGSTEDDLTRLLGGADPAPRHAVQGLTVLPMSSPAAAVRPDVPVPDAVASLLSLDALLAGRAQGPVITLDELVRRMVLRDPVIKQALSDVAAAQGNRVTAETMPNPSVIATQALLPFPGRAFTPERPAGPPQLDVLVAYRLDGIVFGKRAAAVAREERAVDQAAAVHADVVRKRAWEAISAYYDVLQARAEVALATDVLGHAKQFETSLGSGAAAASERGRLRVFSLSSHREVVSATQRLEMAKARLRSHLDLKEGEPTPEPRGLLDPGDPPPPPDLEKVWRAALTVRPDLVAARRGIAYADASRAAEGANAWPELSAIGIVSHQVQTIIGAPNAWSWGAGVSGTLPISDRNQGRKARADAEMDGARAALSATTLEARREVEEALAHYRAAQKIIVEEDDDLVRVAAEMRESIRQAYRSGNRSLVEVLDAEEAYRESLAFAIDAHANYLRALHRLNLTVGSQVAP